MKRRQILSAPMAIATASLLGGCATTPAAEPASQSRTRWRVQTSEGLDAIAFLGPLSGKPFYARYYEKEIATFKPRLAPAALTALDAMMATADAAGYLLWPHLALIFSGAPNDTVVELIASLDAAESALQPSFFASVYWDEKEWQNFLAMRPQIRVVFQALHDAGFSAFRKTYVVDEAANRQRTLLALFEKLDVIAEQERLLGRSLDPLIDVTLLWFCRPHGVRVQGQRFLAHLDSSDATMVLTAAHEVLHPPFPMNGATAKKCLDVLGRDALFSRILAEKNRDSGYNSLDGILEEDIVQALDQIIQERLGFGRAPATRWSESDEGMHVLAAGLYGMLKAEGFDRSGGNIEQWMYEAANSGKLNAPSLHAAAALVLGRPEDQLWRHHKPQS